MKSLLIAALMLASLFSINSFSQSVNPDFMAVYPVPLRANGSVAASFEINCINMVGKSVTFTGRVYRQTSISSTGSYTRYATVTKTVTPTSYSYRTSVDFNVDLTDFLNAYDYAPTYKLYGQLDVLCSSLGMDATVDAETSVEPILPDMNAYIQNRLSVYVDFTKPDALELELDNDGAYPIDITSIKLVPQNGIFTMTDNSYSSSGNSLAAGDYDYYDFTGTPNTTGTEHFHVTVEATDAEGAIGKILVDDYDDVTVYSSDLPNTPVSMGTVTIPSTGRTGNGVLISFSGISDNSGINKVEILVDGGIVNTQYGVSSGSFCVFTTAGTHTVIVKATAADGDVGTSSGSTTIYSGPVINNLMTSMNPIISSWSVTVDATGYQLEYLHQLYNGYIEVENSGFVTQNTWTFNNLLPMTAYKYEVEAKDLMGSISVKDFTFFTSASTIYQGYSFADPSNLKDDDIFVVGVNNDGTVNYMMVIKNGMSISADALIGVFTGDCSTVQHTAVCISSDIAIGTADWWLGWAAGAGIVISSVQSVVQLSYSLISAGATGVQVLLPGSTTTYDDLKAKFPNIGWAALGIVPYVGDAKYAKYGKEIKHFAIAKPKTIFKALGLADVKATSLSKMMDDILGASKYTDEMILFMKDIGGKSLKHEDELKYFLKTMEAMKNPANFLRSPALLPYTSSTLSKIFSKIDFSKLKPMAASDKIAYKYSWDGTVAVKTVGEMFDDIVSTKDLLETIIKNEGSFAAAAKSPAFAHGMELINEYRASLVINSMLKTAVDMKLISKYEDISSTAAKVITNGVENCDFMWTVTDGSGVVRTLYFQIKSSFTAASEADIVRQLENTRARVLAGGGHPEDVYSLAMGGLSNDLISKVIYKKSAYTADTNYVFVPDSLLGTTCAQGKYVSTLETDSLLIFDDFGEILAKIVSATTLTKGNKLPKTFSVDFSCGKLNIACPSMMPVSFVLYDMAGRILQRENFIAQPGYYLINVKAHSSVMGIIDLRAGQNRIKGKEITSKNRY